ncbi:vgr related protein [Novosphingobium sp. 1949]|uniref:Vgr related protein n=1 Tax=Novosphingobium organovorum TaxID=2930092 RepID=A0ABT0BAP4_9SPHN|nr:vgr related protein [Novosphingobium organovorum]MCJ2181891.1 vgr related protein [Novosphingobium organovorum]
MSAGEVALATSVFGAAIAYDIVRIRRSRWFFAQPANTVMAPCGHLHFHPHSPLYRDDFATASIDLQGLFIHEMTHVWQAQSKGRFYLPTRRHPFCRYAYALHPGWPLARYGLEQQAEIVRHTFLLGRGIAVAGAPPLAAYEAILPFRK